MRRQLDVRHDRKRRSGACPAHCSLGVATLVQVEVKDGRVLCGRFSCMDRQGNLILMDAHERQAIGGRWARTSCSARDSEGGALRQRGPSDAEGKGCVGYGHVSVRHVRPRRRAGVHPARREERRRMGQVLIPPHQRVSCCVERDAEVDAALAQAAPQGA